MTCPQCCATFFVTPGTTATVSSGSTVSGAGDRHPRGAVWPNAILGLSVLFRQHLLINDNRDARIASTKTLPKCWPWTGGMSNCR